MGIRRCVLAAGPIRLNLPVACGLVAVSCCMHHLSHLLRALGRHSAAHGPVLAALTHQAPGDPALDQPALPLQVNLAVAWGLVAVCCTHHLGHFLHELGWHGAAHGPLLAALAQPGVSLALGAAALAGPGRPLVVDGAKSLFRCDQHLAPVRRRPASLSCSEFPACLQGAGRSDSSSSCVNGHPGLTK